MSELRIYDEAAPARPVTVLTGFADIRSALARIGVDFERWEAAQQLDAEAGQDEVIEAYREPINRLMKQHGFQSVDVVSMHPDHPQREAMRDKFLAEHVHDDFEVRFFVDGESLFCMRHGGQVYAMLCVRGDLINLPAGLRHWFDMGPQPNFKAIRLFTTPDGWVAHFSGDTIALNFPRLEAPYYPMARAG